MSRDMAALVARLLNTEGTSGLMAQAASALERLQAQVKKLEAKVLCERERTDRWVRDAEKWEGRCRNTESDFTAVTQDREALLAVARAAQTGCTKVEAEPASSGAARAAYWDLYNTVRQPLAALPAHLRKELEP